MAQGFEQSKVGRERCATDREYSSHPLSSLLDLTIIAPARTFFLVLINGLGPWDIDSFDMDEISRESKALTAPQTSAEAVSGLWTLTWRVILAQFLLAIW